MFRGRALGELEALASTGLTGLLTFLHAVIASEQASLLQDRAELRISSDQGTGDAHTSGTHLAVHTTAAGTVKITSKGVDATINVPAGNTVLPFGNITKVFDTGTTIADADLFGIR